MGDFYDVVCEEIPLKGKKTGRGRVDVRVEKGYKKGPQQRIATALSGVIIREFYDRPRKDAIKGCKRLF